MRLVHQSVLAEGLKQRDLEEVRTSIHLYPDALDGAGIFAITTLDGRNHAPLKVDGFYMVLHGFTMMIP